MQMSPGQLFLRLRTQKDATSRCRFVCQHLSPSLSLVTHDILNAAASPSLHLFGSPYCSICIWHSIEANLEWTCNPRWVEQASLRYGNPSLPMQRDRTYPSTFQYHHCPLHWKVLPSHLLAWFRPKRSLGAALHKHRAAFFHEDGSLYLTL